MADPTPRHDPTIRLDGSTERMGPNDPSVPPAGRVWRGNPGELFAGSYRLERNLGGGGESDVYVATDLDHGRETVVVKIYRGNFEADEAVLDHLLGLDHPDILRLLKYGRAEGKFYEVSEYAAGGSLEGAKFDEPFLRKVVIPESLNAFRYCHSNGIIHRDIRPENLLFRDSGRTDLVVGDFGLSSALLSGQTVRMTSRKGISESYSAPELMSGLGKAEDQRFGKEVDYYALGMTLLALLLGRDPFQGEPLSAIRFQKLDGDIQLPDNISPEFQVLLRGLLHPQRKKRWGENEVERWLKGELVPVEKYERTGPEFRYSIAGSVARSPKELAKLLQENPEDAKEHLGDGVFDRKVEEYDTSLGVKLRRVLKKAPSLDCALIEIIYILDPSLPYRLLPSEYAQNPEELAVLIDRDPEHMEAGKRQLFSKLIPTWLETIGQRTIIDDWAKNLAQYQAPQHQDEGLEYFLHLLKPSLGRPILKINPSTLRLPTIPGGERTATTFTISNAGRGYLAGSIEVDKPDNGVQISKNVFTGRVTEVSISADTATLERGRLYQTSLRLTSNSASHEVHVPVRFRTTLPFAQIFSYTLRFGAICAAVCFGYRYLIGSIGGRTPAMWLDQYYPGAQVLILSGNSLQQVILPFGFLYLGLVVLLLILIGKKLNGCLITLLGFGALASTGIGAFALFFITAYLDRALEFSWASPSIMWAALGCPLGCSMGLLRASSACQVKPLRTAALGIVTVVLAALLLVNNPILKLSQEREEAAQRLTQLNEAQLQEMLSILPKEAWAGKVSDKPATLQFRSDGQQLAATVTYDNIAEELSVQTSPGFAIVMKGTSYRRVNNSNAGFNLDTFTGKLSDDRQTLSGTFEDTQRNRGNWTFSPRPAETVVGDLGLLPETIRNSLDSEYPGWAPVQTPKEQIAECAQSNPAFRPWVVWGDFDGDGQREYAVEIRSSDQTILVMFLNQGSGFQHVEVDRGTSLWGVLGVANKGDSIPDIAKNTTQVVQADTLLGIACGKSGVAYVRSGSSFEKVWIAD